ncbi:MAG: histidine--tRNA ligase [Candidatus Paceibacterota bacterium]
MADKNLPTEPYKGVRDFYPDDMAVQRYMFDVWSQTAESFGYARYDASVLEPAELYKAKGAENEELVNEQTYTFTDRGDRQVTLRPEMTPTVARMIAAKRKELAFPVRWYSIPNLFRYERAQRGRLREHWQLNCDIFGTDERAADVEIIALAYQTFLNFGADPSMFEIRINDAAGMQTTFSDANFFDLSAEQSRRLRKLTDQRRKLKVEDFEVGAADIFGADTHKTNLFIKSLDCPDPASYLAWISQNAQNPVENPLEYTGYINASEILDGLRTLGITNVVFDPSIVRGFDYYTGVVFEFFDTDPANRRALLGGGRYDNLTELFGGEPIPGIGFGWGDVTLRDFLETHNLLTADITAPTIMVAPTDPSLNIAGQKIAQEIRASGLSVAVDISNRKIGKKITAASDAFVEYVLVLGEDEIASGTYSVKNLTTGEQLSGTLEELCEQLV